MSAYVVSMISETRASLAAALDSGVSVVRLHPQDEIDTAGAQLLVAAVLEARAAGRRLSIELCREEAAGRLWCGLAFDLLPETVWLEEDAT
ncbi:hypothetical protein [Salipiger mangrovisoli]|uniref:STAS domain-containing protein n=1 Tax=Salipiger mangrovisoli TaxID=2865933 RepID=A0ABR9WYH0_9RHOB|nr:hypothetical protein [Salipiger mangrovisoli]MBE9636318.1 hypothetical protein [Salipiger mangrovisoli]